MAGSTRNKGIVAAFALMLLPAVAHAGPIRWVFEDTFFFGDSAIDAPELVASVTGSFVYDADLDEYSQINITTGSGFWFASVPPDNFPNPPWDLVAYEGEQYDAIFPNAEAGTGGNFWSTMPGADGNVQILSVAFATALDPLLGIVDLAAITEVRCFPVTCAGFDAFRVQTPATQGYVRAEAVPVPGALYLFLTGILGLVVARRRKSVGA